MQAEGKVLGVVYSSGDLGDIGRHAVAAALELPPSVVSVVRVMCRDASTIEEPDWKCGCIEDHVFTAEDRKRLEIVNVDCTAENMAQHLEGVDAIISCLGHRKPFDSDQIAKVGTEHLVDAMLKQNVERIVMISSVGLWDDWPPTDKLLAGFFRTICWQNYQDLTGAELAVRKVGNLNFLIVRAALTPEQAVPEGTWYVQNKKGDGTVGGSIAKMDCARFMVREAVEPSLTRRAVVVGGKPTSLETE